MVFFEVRNASSGQTLFHAKAGALPPVGLIIHDGAERMTVASVEAVVKAPPRGDSGPGAVPELHYVVYVLPIG